MKKFSAIIITLAFTLQAAPVSDTCNQETWITNGPVLTILPSGNKVYIGGVFSNVGPYTGGGAPINSSTGLAAPKFPKIKGDVYAVCTDGNGGWFFGGEFTYAGDMACNDIAHIFPSGNVDQSWNPNANGRVSSLILNGTTVYAAGGLPK